MMKYSIVLFDGVCNYCNVMVNFVLANDGSDCFHFAAQQSEGGRRIMKEYGLEAADVDSFYLIEEGKVYTHSTAVFRVVKRLNWYWRWLSVFIVIPRFIRDFVYDFIARNRYRIFGKRNVCMVPGKDVEGKFLI